MWGWKEATQERERKWEVSDHVGRRVGDGNGWKERWRGLECECRKKVDVGRWNMRSFRSSKANQIQLLFDSNMDYRVISK